jgi:hypothetical protein
MEKRMKNRVTRIVGWALFGGWPTKLPIAVCSVPIWQPEYAA